MATNVNDQYQPEERWRAVVDHGSGMLVVNAGPGTGKTYSLLRKIEKLLAGGAAPNGIYYLTFANSIVDAFKDDIARPTDQGGLGLPADELGIHVSTLHSLAFKIIKSHARKLGLPDHQELVELATRTSDPLHGLVVEDLYALLRFQAAVPDKATFKRQLRQIGITWRGELPTPDSLRPFEAAVALLETRYHILPWDRLVTIANGAISQHGLPTWLHNGRHFLIDEFQDFNPSEQRHIKLISEPSDSVVVVGDIDQSIYSGRSALPDGLATLLGGDVSTVNFVLCRRCPKAVINGANKMLTLIDPLNGAARHLVAHKTDEGVLTTTPKKSCKQEVTDLVQQLEAWQQAGESEILLLFPDRKTLDHYKSELSKRGVVCDGRERSDTVDRLRALLRLAALRQQPLLERFLITYFRRLEVRYPQDVLPRLPDLPLREALEAAARDAGWQKPVRQAYQDYLSARDDLTSGDVARIVAACTRLGHSITQESVETALNEAIALDVRVRVEMATVQAAEPDRSFRVRCLTMHSSKGLSKGIVVMPGLEDKWIPGKAEGNDLLERHRLFYVALTRAEREVHITYPKTRAATDPLNYTPDGTGSGPSRYLTRMRMS